jgi:hypothetical protein
MLLAIQSIASSSCARPAGRARIETWNLLLWITTRARDHLLVTGVEPASEFLDDLKG